MDSFNIRYCGNDITGYAENAYSGSEFRKDCCGVVEKNHIVAKKRLNFKRKQMI
jgi:hypothetical protein